MSGWLLQALTGSTVLIVAVLLVRPWLLRRFGPRLAYGLWLVPAARLVWPAVPVWTVPNSAIAILGPDPAAFGGAPGSQASLLAEFLRADAVIPLLVGVWAFGAIVHLAWGLSAYRSFMRRAGAAVVGPDADQDGVAVRTSAFVRGPVAAGVWRRRIFLPLDFALRFGPDQQRLALAHERTHHRRCDIVWNFVALAAVSAHWFNPLAHHAYRLYRLDQELACDADVVAAFPACRPAYGALLARAAWRGGAGPACALGRTGRAGAIKQRLIALAASSGAASSGLSPAQAMACLAPVAIAGLLLTAPVSLVETPMAVPVVPAAPRQPIAHTPPVPAPRSDAVAPGPRETRARRTAPSRPHALTASVTPSPGETLASRPDLAESPLPTDHLAQRRAAGLERSRFRRENPVQAARDRGRPILPPSQT